MKCKLCGKFYSYEIKFNNLFKTMEICDICQSYYKPILREETIPLDNGYIQYYYLFDEIKINKEQSEYLIKHFDILYKKILENGQNIVLIIDEYSYKYMEKEIDFILSFRKITFVSLARYNFEKFVNFY